MLPPSLSAGVQLNLFLLADGVAAARRGQKTPTGYYNVADMLSELIAKGVKVKT
jgi:sulfur relay (sulfurtransferase) complex TusBCD TusD component (DsrE family)